METTAHFTWAGLILIPMLLLILVTCAFWIWMVVDCLTNNGLQGNDKIVWVLVILFTHFIGALIYFFIGRPKRHQFIPPPIPR